MKSSELISEIKTLLAPREAWRKYVLALDKKGNEVAMDDSEACQFCLVGAFNNRRIAANLPDAECDAIGAKFYFYVSMAILELFPELEIISAIHFNDHTHIDHGDVLRVLECAQKLAQEAGE